MPNNSPHLNPPRPGRKNYAFTLAEVLITLVIIGVIAAITVPSLINKTNNQETVSKLKKAYSTLAQATNQIIMDEGPVSGWVSSTENVYNLFRKKLLNAKECSSSRGCFTQGSYTYLKGGETGFDNNSNGYKLIFNDGMQVMFWANNPDCDTNAYGSLKVCQFIVVDINGARKPNIIGRDVFGFALKKDALYPAGCDGNNCSKNDYGVGCTCKVLREEAINY